MSLSPSPRRTPRLLAATAGALALTLVAAPAQAATVAATGASDAGAGYLLRQFGSGDRIAGFDTASGFGVTADAVVSLVAAGYGRDVVPRALDYLATGAGAAYAQEGGVEPGRTGKLVLAFAAAQRDPRSVGGVDLVAQIEGSLVPAGDATRPAGRYEEADGNNAPLKHSLALLGLRAAAVTPDPSAVSYLLSQQCDAPATAAGGFPGNPVNPVAGTTTCPSVSPQATAYAVMALAAVGGQTAAVSAGLDRLEAVQNPDGGYGFAVGAGTDANSTGLAVQAVIAGGEDPAAGRWDAVTGSLESALLGLQAGLEYTEQPALRGGFFYDAATRSSTDDDFNDPDSFTSSQAAGAATGQALPVRSVAVSALSADEPVITEAAAPSSSPSASAEPTATAGPAGPAPTTAAPSTTAPTTDATVETTAEEATGATSGATATTAATLPRTGGSTGLLLLSGLGVLGAGVAMVVVPRRRSAGTHQA